MKKINLRRGTGTLVYGYMILMVAFIVALTCIEQISKYINTIETQMVADSIADGTAVYMSGNRIDYEDAIIKANEIVNLCENHTGINVSDVYINQEELERERVVKVALTANFYETNNADDVYAANGNNTNNYNITRVAATSFYSTVGAVTTPRLDGTETELTMGEVRSNPWYSTASPFQGQYSLIGRGGNCTAYAWSRRCELEGFRTKLPTGDAGGWYDDAVIDNVYECGQTPKVGAVCCWSTGFPGNTSGHVAVIEIINEDGSITTSQSSYGTNENPVLFSNGYYGNQEELEASYGYFNGYIYIEEIEEE